MRRDLRSVRSDRRGETLIDRTGEQLCHYASRSIVLRLAPYIAGSGVTVRPERSSSRCLPAWCYVQSAPTLSS
jgi:hypothetical protein